MKQKSTFMSLIAILSLTMLFASTLIDDASALKSVGNPLLKYGSVTDNIVCGGTLCSEVSTITVADRTINIEGLNIFYLEVGPSDAPTVLLLHVIVPNMIGYRRSSMPTVDKFEYMFAHQTQIIE